MSSQTRRSPRYSRQLEVDVDGLEIVTTNVAIGGVQLSCPEMRYAGFRRAGRDDGTWIKVRLPGTRDWIKVRGIPRYADLCEDEYLIGFQFTDFDSGAAAAWAAYIDTLAHAKPID